MRDCLQKRQVLLINKAAKTFDCPRFSLAEILSDDVVRGRWRFCM